MAEKGSRYKTEEVRPSVAMQLLDGVLSVASGGAIKSTVEIKTTDRETGKTSSGYGTTTREAKSDAYSKLKK